MLAHWLEDIEAFEAISQDADTRRIFLRMSALSRGGSMPTFLNAVAQDGTEIEIDSRPSDAIALAIRAEAPIFAADRVIEESAIEFEGDEVTEEQLEEEVAKFKHFLDEVTPDEFALENGDEED